MSLISWSPIYVDGTLISNLFLMILSHTGVIVKKKDHSVVHHPETGKRL